MESRTLTLPMGDLMFERNGKLLDVVIERKGVADLGATFKDGRIFEQFYKSQISGISRSILLIIGQSGHYGYGSLNLPKLIRQAEAIGWEVVNVKNKIDARRFIHDASVFTNATPFTLDMVSQSIKSTFSYWARMLASIPGISSGTAWEIAQKSKSASQLAAMLDSKTTCDQIKELQSLVKTSRVTKLPNAVCMSIIRSGLGSDEYASVFRDLIRPGPAEGRVCDMITWVDHIRYDRLWCIDFPTVTKRET